MRRGLQVTMGVLSLVPLIFGLQGMLIGASSLMEGQVPTAAIDSQFRFLSAWYLALVALIWWIIPQVERQTTVFRIVIACIFLGGVARLLAIQAFGMPPANMVGGLILELALPLLIPWQTRVARAA